MDDICDVRIVKCEKSNFIKPLRVFYCQNGKQKIWDAVKVHDSVSILIFNSTRNTFVFVRQFRPAVYINSAEISKDTGSDDHIIKIDHTKYPGSLGLTYELCAGIVDQNKTIEEIAQQELLEECGYQVPLNSLIRIIGYRNGVGSSAAKQDMFYVNVTDEMKVSAGGGNCDEGEMIDIVEVSVTEGKSFIMDETKPKPVGVMFAVLWFYDNIYQHKL